MLACRFRAVAARRGDAGALSFREPQGWCTWGYRHLGERVLAIAEQLREHGVAAGEPVGLMVHRHPDTIASMLAILAVGAFYVPLDPQHPAARHRLLCEEARIQRHVAVRVDRATGPSPEVVVSVAARGTQVAAVEARVQVDTASADLPAYVMFTSGSTGRPKGVVVPHRAVLRLVEAPNFVQLDESRVFLLASPLSFDASTLEVWAPLLHGGRCVLYPPDALPTAAGLREVIRGAGVNSAWLTASLFHAIVDHDVSCLDGLEDLLVGGEALSVAHVGKALEALPGVRLVNGYGPTENTTFTTCYRVPRDFPRTARRVPIGFPVTGTQVQVVDDRLRPVPVGTPGELVAMGEGLALGYLNQPELTRERFCSVRGADGVERRGYRTGDRVVLDPAGWYDFLGRLDDQVKIDGYRIEPREVECLVAALPGVAQCRVVARDGTDGRKRLVAYLVLTDAGRREAVARAMAETLPGFLTPHQTVVLPELPVNKNGKLAVEALPLPGAPRPASFGSEPLAAVGEAWTRVLGAAPASPDVNFFDAGGKSLDALRLQALLSERCGDELEPTFVFEFPTVRTQAEALASMGHAPRLRRTATDDRSGG